MREQLQKVFDEHKKKLDNIKTNRALDGEGWTDTETKVVDEYIQGLAAILGDINQILNNEAP